MVLKSATLSIKMAKIRPRLMVNVFMVCKNFIPNIHFKIVLNKYTYSGSEPQRSLFLENRKKDFLYQR